jgi:hypothetical protein
VASSDYLKSVDPNHLIAIGSEVGRHSRGFSSRESSGLVCSTEVVNMGNDLLLRRDFTELAATSWAATQAMEVRNPMQSVGHGLA